VDLGTTSALGNILGVRFSSLLGTLIWKAVYFRELGYNLNRARVLADWAVDFFSQPDTSKLLED
jgi:NADH dehydrogenase FAD-containing subunit